MPTYSPCPWDDRPGAWDVDAAAAPWVLVQLNLDEHRMTKASAARALGW